MAFTKSIIVSDAKPLAEYKWGGTCDAYFLVDNDALQVKLEQVPPHSGECLHHHERTQQFFYVLQGEAQMRLNDEWFNLKAGEGILVEPGCRHTIENHSDELLRFVVTSQPAVTSDRVDGIISH